ncbi:hypothetical protein Prum_069020 [Phytohabitans rumicis]|uniref:Uncharacterized protein n=1 Tax=Phytohabitans rumicis TaxID=1076125 RepID=A0A6V8LC98_9ACTN|nr:hypothetical protein Prum_069020 [Phytohabitans rumicis]
MTPDPTSQARHRGGDTAHLTEPVVTGATVPPSGDHKLTYHQAAQNWNDHQPDRAWIECGFHWPPLTIGRPRCRLRECGLPWPCPPARAADAWLSRYEATQSSAAAA